jgi:hypothetical protein
MSEYVAAQMPADKVVRTSHGNARPRGKKIICFTFLDDRWIMDLTNIPTEFAGRRRKQLLSRADGVDCQ